MDDRGSSALSRAVENAVSRGTDGIQEVVNALHKIYLSPNLRAAMLQSLRDVRLIAGQDWVELSELIASDRVRASFAELVGKRVEFTRWTNANFSNDTKGKVLGRHIEALHELFKRLSRDPITGELTLPGSGGGGGGGISGRASISRTLAVSRYEPYRVASEGNGGLRGPKNRFGPLLSTGEDF